MALIKARVLFKFQQRPQQNPPDVTAQEQKPVCSSKFEIMQAVRRVVAVGNKAWVHRIAVPWADIAGVAAVTGVTAAALCAVVKGPGAQGSRAFCHAQDGRNAPKQAELVVPAMENETQAQGQEEGEEMATRQGIQRYAGFAATARVFLIKGIIKGKRYVAYSSDVGEAFRPVVSPAVVKGAYVLAWSYVIGDVLYSGYLAHKGGATRKDVAITVAHAATFQTLASMLIPMFTIHTVVHQAQKLALKTGKFVKWGPTVAGMALFPLLPLVDKPVEDLVDYVFDNIFPGRRKEPGHGH